KNDLNVIKRDNHSIDPKNKMTLLHRAAKIGATDICRDLLADDDINPFIKDNEATTAAGYAYQYAKAHPDNPEATVLLQLFVDNHCAVDVVWLDLPNAISIKDKLMVGHIVTNGKEKDGHLYDEKSISRIKKSLAEDEKQKLIKRINQYRHVVAQPELKSVWSQLSAMLNELGYDAKADKEANNKQPTKNGEVHLDIVNPWEKAQNSRVNFAQYKQQLKELKSVLENTIKQSSSALTRKETFDAQTVYLLSNVFLKNIALFILCPEIAFALIYNAIFGMVIGIGAIPACSNSSIPPMVGIDVLGGLPAADVPAPNGNPPTNSTETCDPGWSPNNWRNIDKTEEYSNEAIGGLILVTIFCILFPKLFGKGAEKISAYCEDKRQARVANVAEADIAAFFVDLKQQSPELYMLVSEWEPNVFPEVDDSKKEQSAEVSDQEMLDSMSNRILARLQIITDAIDTQTKNLLPQGEDVRCYPKLNVGQLFRHTTRAPIEVNEMSSLLSMEKLM
ncbi:MAG: hypothetical protein ACK4PR_05280, partial [Gammaproteobacteria bacterium]